MKITASDNARDSQHIRAIPRKYQSVHPPCGELTELDSNSSPPKQNGDLLAFQSPQRTVADDKFDKLISETVSVWRRVLYLFLAAFFFALAIAGVILPVLPTTPFLLLTSYFLVRSYPRLNEKLLKLTLFGSILVDWQVNGGVRRDVKTKAISIVIIAIGFSIYITAFSLRLSLIIAAVASLGIVVIVNLPEPRD